MASFCTPNIDNFDIIIIIRIYPSELTLKRSTVVNTGNYFLHLDIIVENKQFNVSTYNKTAF